MPDFKEFPNLPKELRLKIWEHAAQQPRIVEICQPMEDESWHPDLSASQNESEDENDENEHDREDDEVDEEEEEEEEEDEDEDEEDEDVIKRPKCFYSPTVIPSILHVNRESRTIALEVYTSHQFPIQDATEFPIFYNPSIDILYFPAWCFERDIETFETWTSPASKDTITRIAIENLVWYTDSCEDGKINDQIQISNFKNLQEFYLVGREPDELGCGCCHEFHIERGIVSFETEEEEEQKRRMEQEEFESGGWTKAKGSEKVEEREEKRKKGRSRYNEKVVRDVKKEFECILDRDPKWCVPEIRIVRLKRDDVLV